MIREKIVAYKITPAKIYYKCPHCWTNPTGTKTYDTNLFKNGLRCLGRKPTIHHHGNETKHGQNFSTSRSSHCPYQDTEIEICITDETIRE